MIAKQTITPFLWFDDQAEQAVAHYLAIFQRSRVLRTSRYGEAGPGGAAMAGKVMVIEFELDGQVFNALNGGPHFKFSEAISLLVNCPTQAEIDRLWERLGEGGSPGRCGWLKDKFGLSWQIVPERLGQWMSDPDPARAGRVMQAMLPMGKIDIARLQQAGDQP
jgi:predicted 3-demethylubiquinone-9 3-methyltransferase (glyoxalase superfamily)